MLPEHAAESGDTVIPATGNGMKSHDTCDTFLTVSQGDGNLAGAREVHLLLHSNDGEFSQGWFRLDDLLAALNYSPGERVPE